MWVLFFFFSSRRRHTRFRVRLVGKTNVPLRGPAVLASNHVSYADGFLIGGGMVCPIPFLMWETFFYVFWLGWIFFWVKTIPRGDTRPRGICFAVRPGPKELGDG